MKRVVFAFVFGLCGCTGMITDPSDEGLTIFTADREAGLSGMFQAGERVVFFETVRLDDPLEEPDLGPAVAVRFADAYGRTIQGLTMGHGFPEEWRELTTERDADLVALAARALARAGVEPEITAEKGRLMEMAVHAEAIALQQSDATADAEVPYSTMLAAMVVDAETRPWQTVDERDAVPYSTSAWIQAGQVFKKNLKVWGIKYGEHSSLRDIIFQSDGGAAYVIGYLDYCNHGSCPWARDMNYRGDQWGYWLPYVPSWAGACDWGNPWPDSWYNFTSIWGHNCNDDTVYQMQNIKQGWIGDSLRTCNDSSRRDDAPWPW